MQSVKSLSKGKKHVALFYHTVSACTVIATCNKDQFKRGDVAFDKKGRMICRAVHEPSLGAPLYDLRYQVASLVLDGEPEETREFEAQLALEEGPEAAPES